MMVSVDPGARSGVAVWAMAAGSAAASAVEAGGHRLLSLEAVAMPAGRPHAPIAMRYLESALLEGDTLVIEGQWVAPAEKRRGARGHSRSVIELVERRCAWQHAAELLGATAVLVQPAKWMAMVKQLPGGDGAHKAKRLARHLGHDVGLDEAAALCIGLWWLRGR